LSKGNFWNGVVVGIGSRKAFGLGMLDVGEIGMDVVVGQGKIADAAERCQLDTALLHSTVFIVWLQMAT
jgi:hypothetical protein